jgi:hypothetical protein
MASSGPPFPERLLYILTPVGRIEETQGGCVLGIVLSSATVLRLPKNLIALVLYQGHDFHRSPKKSLSDWFAPGHGFSRAVKPFIIVLETTLQAAEKVDFATDSYQGMTLVMP